jgi:hypothetical protein
MQHFDFIDTLTAAYGFLWRNRRVVLAMAFVPLLIKIACLVVIFAFGLETAYLRQGLLALPSYFAEGVLTAKLIIMAGRGGDVLYPAPARDDRRVMAATLVYVLVKLALAFAGGMGMMIIALQEANATAPADGSPSLLFAVIFLLGVMIWAARLAWLYVPVAQGYSMMAFLMRVRGLKISFVLIGTWLVCFVPLGLLLILVAGMLENVLGHTADDPSQIYRFVVIVLQAALDLLAGLVSSLAIGFGIHTIMSAPAPKGENA